MTPGEYLFGVGFADEPAPVAAVSAYRQAAGSTERPEAPEMSDDDYDLTLETRAQRWAMRETRDFD